ncbi:MAG: hypothetical protein AB1894_06980 [Chloroflexota bacterium]
MKRLIIFAALTISHQINQPLILLADELKHIQENNFNPSTLDKLTKRQDEMGYLAREYLQMASAVQNRQAMLQQEAEEIRGKIR